nr:hypothetical protein GCM10010200_106950 [Actinomadura rugatobispora]
MDVEHVGTPDERVHASIPVPWDIGLHDRIGIGARAGTGIDLRSPGGMAADGATRAGGDPQP